MSGSPAGSVGPDRVGPVGEQVGWLSKHERGGIWAGVVSFRDLGGQRLEPGALAAQIRRRGANGSICRVTS
jgi:hypothetical protein